MNKMFVSFLIAVSCLPMQAKERTKNKNLKAYTVVCIVEAKPGKESELKQALLKVVEPSRNETTCLEYRLHQDVNNPAQFVLYENWVSKEAHQKQFQKPYIVEFVSRLNDLLAKPYTCSCAQEL